MGTMKTPGVYIVEKNAFPNSVVEVATAVPAFIGYTEKAEHNGRPLNLRPWRITSMVEFEACFGGAPTKDHVRFSLEAAPGGVGGVGGGPEAALAARDLDVLQLGGQGHVLRQKSGLYLLHHAMQLFFRNGGGPCWVVSVGTYATEGDGQQPKAGVQVSKAALSSALPLLEREAEPTLVVVPEAVLLPAADCAELQQAVLRHCGTVGNRFAILDVREGYRPRGDHDCVAAFRDAIGTDFLAFGAAYYPWVHSSVVPERELDWHHLCPQSRGTLKRCIQHALEALQLPAAALAEVRQVADTIGAPDGPQSFDALCRRLPAIEPLCRRLQAEMARRLNLLPPGAALAGVYTMVDGTRGVWKAPANVALDGVAAPAVVLTDDEQEDLNVTPTGKSVNALRSFLSEGLLVWGARTLDGNSLDWRYVNVRRTVLMLEASIRLAAKAMAFEPNVFTTWVTVKSMIINFLTSVWRRGGLAGAVPEEAFSVHVGLGETMTPEDILAGVLRVTVLVAVVRGTESIEITFEQQMQKA